MKKLVSICICLSMCLSLVAPAAALREETPSSDRLEIIYGTNDVTLATSSDSEQIRNGTPFEVRQFSNEELIQTVTGTVCGESLVITDYADGKIVAQQTIPVSDIITHNDTPALTGSLATAESGISVTSSSLIGYMTFNPVYYETSSRRVSVYSDLYDSDNEAYTIHGKVTDTIAMIAGAITSALVTYFSKDAELGYQIAVSIVGALGGNVENGVIGIAFSEDVAVYAYYYSMKTCDYSTGRYSYEYKGTAKRVSTKNSSYYNKWFYDGYTPYTWTQLELFPYYTWNDLWPLDTYPGVKIYG